MNWWCTMLSAPHICLPLKGAPPVSNIHIFVDTSTSWGIGFVMNGKWLVWPFHDGTIDLEHGHNIGWAEFMAIELALLALIQSGAQKIMFTLHSDNRSVVDAFKGRRSCSPLQNMTLHRILLLFHEFDISFITTWVPSKENLADGPS
jgi:hypothetical protein